jgi:hypothetical protein
MRLPFQHKEEEITIPFYEVKKLREEGKSDKEIISQLKERGYSFEAIEKAMLQVLKEGITPKEEKQVEKEEKKEVVRELPTREDIEKPKFAFPQAEFPLESDFEPTDLIEEVVEGVVEEKFEKLDTKFEYIHNELEKIRKDNEALKSFVISSIEKENKLFEGLKKENEKLKREIEDLIIKTNALERAFKQFLPDIFVRAREKKLEEENINVIESEKYFLKKNYVPKNKS